MSIREQFSEGEWQTVLLGPGQAGLAVVAAAPSGLTGVLAELGAVAGVLRELSAQPSPPPLIAAMVEALREGGPSGPQQRPGSRSFGQVKDDALQGLRQAFWLVRAHSSPQDVAAYRTLVLEVARRTAEAAREGGFLGLGGVQVSEAEREVLREIEALVTPG